MLVDELRTITDKAIKEAFRKNQIVTDLKNKLMEVAKTGKFYYTTEVLYCHPEEVDELLEILQDEGINISKKTIQRQINMGMFHEPEDDNKYEEVIIYTFSWDK